MDLHLKQAKKKFEMKLFSSDFRKPTQNIMAKILKLRLNKL